MRRLSLALALVFGGIAAGTRSEYLSIKQKFKAIETQHTRPGAKVALPSNELNAYVQTELPTLAPSGVRQASVELLGNNMARGRAMVNFVKLQSANGNQPGWLMSKILDGERPLVVTAQVVSANGQATVYLKRVEFGGVPVEGNALDFLIANYLLPNYPNALIGRPFQLDHRMDRLEVQPGVAYVVIKP